MYNPDGSIRDKREMLKVLIKFTAEQPRVMRKEEQRLVAVANPTKTKFKKRVRYALHKLQGEARMSELREAKMDWHAARSFKPYRPDNPIRDTIYKARTCECRPLLRAMNIAYALVRGKTVASVEAAARTVPNWELVSMIVAEFGQQAANVEVVVSEARQTHLNCRQISYQQINTKRATAIARSA